MAELHIKNMVCDRCKMVVRQELINNGLTPVEVNLGIARIKEELSPASRATLAKSLDALGFELLEGSKPKLVEQIKNFVIKQIHQTENLDIRVNWSSLLSDALHQEYRHLSSLFSSEEGITLEQYIIRQKIERVKELLQYDQLSLSEISYKLGYSSVQHLSNQFRKITGVTPSQFKASQSAETMRKTLDSI